MESERGESERWRVRGERIGGGERGESRGVERGKSSFKNLQYVNSRTLMRKFNKQKAIFSV